MARLEEPVARQAFLAVIPGSRQPSLPRNGVAMALSVLHWKNSSGSPGTELIFQNKEPELAIQQKGLLPRIAGGALIAPAGLLRKLCGAAKKAPGNLTNIASLLKNAEKVFEG